MMAFSVSSLHVDRAGIPVIRGVDMKVKSGEINVLLGSNGAGKTTLMESLSGIVPVRSGSIAIDGMELTGLRPGLRARAGVSHVEQGRSVFPDMTTEENIKVALHPQANLDEAFALFPELVRRRHVKAAMLSGGEQQMTVIARSIVNRPRIMLIDEMSSGLAPVIVNRLMRAVRQLADNGMAVILVEQFAALALAIGNHACVLRRGEIVYDGSAEYLAGNPARLHELYLGETAAPDGTGAP